MKVENIAMTLYDSLPPLYEYLITALNMLPMKDLMMENITTHLMPNRKEKEPKAKMRQWWRVKAKWAIHLHGKA
jgi:hypothetical protein